MGNFYELTYWDKIWNLEDNIFETFYHWEIMGLTSDFLKIMETTLAKHLIQGIG